MLKRFFSEGFRPFFLFAALYGALAGLVWVIWLAVEAYSATSFDFPFGAAPQMWHAHEMIFGYASAALGGFFLTAVPNWTGAKAAREVFIATVFSLWLLGRVAVWYAGILPAGLVMVADLAFVPVLAAKIASQLIKRPKPQNMMFLAILTLFWTANLLVHLEWADVTDDTMFAGLRAGLMSLVAMIAVLGGRITPAFTRNAMKRAGEPEESWPQTPDILNRLTIAGALILPITVLLPLPQMISAAVALIFGIVQLLRLKGWRTGWTMRQPILLALHLGIAMLSIGLIAWGLAGFGVGSEVAGLHFLGIGGVGGMTIAVMGRATLGHSGQPLVASGPMAAGYALIAGAAILRWVGASLASEWNSPLILASGLFWVLAFVLFLAAMLPALLGARAGRA